ncbi:MAG TPA: tRNA (guanosine(37)-N1)-methyltransferase TrmD [Gammaproteobacteria bacterium]|nr:tRNA (guanosine(37)-N1)-methyltransferase TrmD [Gammaproteobacteria bacterium]
MIYFDFVTLFPEMMDSLNWGIVGQAQHKNLIRLQNWNPLIHRDKKYPHIDDKPYGGGPGMILSAKPLINCVESIPARSKKRCIVSLTPDGTPFTQQHALKFAQMEQIILICGRYEGFDARINQIIVDESISIGDYVLSGGELPAMVVCDSVCRHVPGVLGNHLASTHDSFSDGLLEHPQFTRPRSYRQIEVPEVLTSGNHSKVNAWQHQQQLGKTWLKRPELLINRPMSQRDIDLLQLYMNEYFEKEGEDYEQPNRSN